jgi:hypothetical protein
MATLRMAGGRLLQNGPQVDLSVNEFPIDCFAVVCPMLDGLDGCLLKVLSKEESRRLLGSYFELLMA